MTCAKNMDGTCLGAGEGGMQVLPSVGNMAGGTEVCVVKQSRSARPSL